MNTSIPVYKGIQNIDRNYQYAQLSLINILNGFIRNGFSYLIDQFTFIRCLYAPVSRVTRT